MKKPRRISPEGLEVKMSRLMERVARSSGRITERQAGHIAAKLTLRHFRKVPDNKPGPHLTAEETTAGKMCGKNAMCAINNRHVREEPARTIQNLPALDCPKGSCQRHGVCMYLNYPRCPHRRAPA